MPPVTEWGPADWELLQWHVDPKSLRYRSRETAARAVAWLNSHDGNHADWCYRVGFLDPGTARVVLERRWIGRDDGLVGFVGA